MKVEKPSPILRGFRRLVSPQRWPIDPRNVEYGSVVLGGDQAVLVRYTGESEPRRVPVPLFIREINFKLRRGEPLGVAALRLSVQTKRRHATMFDRLTDWSKVTPVGR